MSVSLDISVTVHCIMSMASFQCWNYLHKYGIIL